MTKKFVAKYLVCKPRDLSCKKSVCHRNAEACKSVKIGARGKLCKSELLFEASYNNCYQSLGSWFFCFFSFFGFFPFVVTRRNPLE